jgi:hypothetical protein
MEAEQSKKESEDQKMLEGPPIPPARKAPPPLPPRRALTVEKLKIETAVVTPDPTNIDTDSKTHPDIRPDPKSEPEPVNPDLVAQECDSKTIIVVDDQMKKTDEKVETIEKVEKVASGEKSGEFSDKGPQDEDCSNKSKADDNETRADTKDNQLSNNNAIKNKSSSSLADDSETTNRGNVTDTTSNEIIIGAEASTKSSTRISSDSEMKAEKDDIAAKQEETKSENEAFKGKAIDVEDIKVELVDKHNVVVENQGEQKTNSVDGKVEADKEPSLSKRDLPKTDVDKTDISEEEIDKRPEKYDGKEKVDEKEKQDVNKFEESSFKVEIKVLKKTDAETSSTSSSSTEEPSSEAPSTNSYQDKLDESTNTPEFAKTPITECQQSESKSSSDELPKLASKDSVGKESIKKAEPNKSGTAEKESILQVGSESVPAVVKPNGQKQVVRFETGNVASAAGSKTSVVDPPIEKSVLPRITTNTSDLQSLADKSAEFLKSVFSSAELPKLSKSGVNGSAGPLKPSGDSDDDDSSPDFTFLGSQNDLEDLDGPTLLAPGGGRRRPRYTASKVVIEGSCNYFFWMEKIAMVRDPK